MILEYCHNILKVNFVVATPLKEIEKMWVIIELLIATVFASLGQVFWKLGMREIGPVMKYDWSMIAKLFMNLQVDIGILFYAVGTIFWLIALSKKDLGYVYPFIVGTYILVLIFSRLILSKSFGLYRSIGAVIVMLGLVVIIKGG